MAEGKHTPGPWEVSIQGATVWGPDRVHTTATGSTLTLRTEIAKIASAAGARAGNARLIAAAPDLLEALKAALPSGVATDNRNVPDEQVIPLDFTMGELRRMSAAIAKAEGRSDA